MVTFWLRYWTPSVSGKYIRFGLRIETGAERTTIVDIFYIIHLEVDEEQWKITQGSKRQAKWVWFPGAMSGLRLQDTPHAQKAPTVHATIAVSFHMESMSYVFLPDGAVFLQDWHQFIGLDLISCFFLKFMPFFSDAYARAPDYAIFFMFMLVHMLALVVSFLAIYASFRRLCSRYGDISIFLGWVETVTEGGR